jgi:hypothetical protein
MDLAVPVCGVRYLAGETVFDVADNPTLVLRSLRGGPTQLSPDAKNLSLDTLSQLCIGENKLPVRVEPPVTLFLAFPGDVGKPDRMRTRPVSPPERYAVASVRATVKSRCGGGK